MKKSIWLVILCSLLCFSQAQAQNMVTKQSYFRFDLSYIGLPDYPPFSYYEKDEYHSVFLAPLQKIAKKYRFKIKPYSENNFHDLTLAQRILRVRSGQANMFLGAYSDTKMYTGLKMIFPAVISNPIHIITLPNTKEKIKNSNDLLSLKGMAIKTEYFSDFVMRKIEPLKLQYAETPYEAYEKLFTGEIDYILGSLYYNKIMASRLGIERYLSYSATPMYKIPVFIALSKQTKLYTLYNNMFHSEFAKVEFGDEVKKEILRFVNKEIEKNAGVVPPAFARHEVEEEVVVDIAPQDDDLGGKVVHEEPAKGPSLEEILKDM